MPCATPCPNCARKGLPILFTRYAAAYSAQAEGMAALEKLQPAGHLQTKPGGVTLQTARYNLRMLRPGYLYVRIKRVGLTREWMGYAVHPHGYLSEFPVALPTEARSNPACEVEIRGATKSLVWVPDAKRVESLHYLFHPDPIDYQHLMDVIEPNLGKYAQRFDVAGWVNGNMSQPDTAQPGQLDGQVMEFAALSNTKLRDAIEPQMYGLMGSNAQERGWGSYEEQVEVRTPAMTPMGDATGFEEVSTETRKRAGPTYGQAHGKRLRAMAEFLQTKNGAVAACNDAIGICQELGHLQSEAQTIYGHWQVQQATGFARGVTNEWVLQTSVSAQSLRDLVKKGAVQAVSAGYEESKMFHAPLPHGPREREKALAERNANREHNKKKELDAAMGKIDGEFARLFNQTAAKTFVDAEHQPAYDRLSALRDKVGTDQGHWLSSSAMRHTMRCYSEKDARIDKHGGGANLSLQLAQCMAGLEGNTWGRTWLKTVDVWGDNALSRMLCFNNMAYLGSLKQAVEQGAQPVSLSAAEADTSLLEGLATKLKFLAGRLSLGDKALAFMDAFPAIGESGRLRKLAWPAHVMTLMSVKMAAGLNAIPVTRKEAQLVRYMALAGVTTLGRTVDKEATRLHLSAEDLKRARARANKLTELATPQRGKAGAAAMDRVRKAAPGTRAAMFAGIFDFGATILKGGQLAVTPNGRTATEMAGNVLQGIGSIADWRAKAYEETIFKGIKGADVYKLKALEAGLDALNLTQLRSLQKMAFKWFLPAALISVWFDGVDARLSDKRGQLGLATAQVASIAGTIFTIGATAVVAFDVSVFGVTAAALGAVLGLIGAVLVVGALIAIALFKEEEWVNWLTDCPLNKSKKPNHDNLQETLQKFANVQAELRPAN